MFELRRKVKNTEVIVAIKAFPGNKNRSNFQNSTFSTILPLLFLLLEDKLSPRIKHRQIYQLLKSIAQ